MKPRAFAGLLILALVLLLCSCKALNNLPKASQPVPTVVTGSAAATPSPSHARTTAPGGKTASQDTAGANTKLPEEASVSH